MTIDVLADVLSVGQVSNQLVCYSEFPEFTGIYFDDPNMASFHIVRRGSVWARHNKGTDPILLEEGDIVFYSNNPWHAISRHLENPVKHISVMKDTLGNISAEHGPVREDSTCMFCGAYELVGDMKHPFFSQLPPVIHIPAEQTKNDKNLRDLLPLLIREGSNDEVGSSIVLSKLMDALLIYIIRIWVRSTSEKNTGWLVALKDPKIGEAISLMHRSPKEKWTIDRLAKEVSMSRASFAKKFTESTGESPGIYLTRWRMDLSVKLLRESNLPLMDIANAVGYESDTAYSRVFKKQRGESPGEYRSSYRLNQL